MPSGCTMKFLASDIRGKTVMTDEGLMLGRLRNVVVEERTGELTTILIEPAEDVDPRVFRRDPRGFLAFPFENVRSVRDVIVVSTANAMA
ncbi:MAG TPA: PRC-barrel domain-containing protein [Candidatus Thermoplasmatota archaeon]|nr:PRC-barrel domain-containing protein [Candidatus Thermoplasmatota archaeon]